MANSLITHFVDNRCKTPCKTLCKSRVFFRANLSSPLFTRAKLPISTFFSFFSHHLFHHPPTSVISLLFHFSTVPTITTTNNIKERI